MRGKRDQGDMRASSTDYDAAIICYARYAFGLGTASASAAATAATTACASTTATTIVVAAVAKRSTHTTAATTIAQSL